MADIHKPESAGAYLGPGTKINGKLHSDGPATIDGQVEGEISGQASVTIGQGASIKENISAISVLIQGKVIADVQAETRLEIRPPGSLVGNVTTQALVVGDGAFLEGTVSMRKEGRVLPWRKDAVAPENDTAPQH